LICEQYGYRAECSLYQTHEGVDCALSEKKCDEEIEEQPCLGQTEDLGDVLGNVLGNLPRKIIHQTATCAQPEPCYKADSQDPCVPEERAHPVGNTLYNDTGICTFSEMVLKCLTDKSKCHAAFIEDEDGAHCS